MDEKYSNIRDIIGGIIGKRVLDVTQHDKEEFESGTESYVQIMFEDGQWVKFPVGDLGFEAQVETEETD